MENKWVSRNVDGKYENSGLYFDNFNNMKTYYSLPIDLHTCISYDRSHYRCKLLNILELLYNALVRINGCVFPKERSRSFFNCYYFSLTHLCTLDVFFYTKLYISTSTADLFGYKLISNFQEKSDAQR